MAKYKLRITEPVLKSLVILILLSSALLVSLLLPATIEARTGYGLTPVFPESVSAPSISTFTSSPQNPPPPVRLPDTGDQGADASSVPGRLLLIGVGLLIIAALVTVFDSLFNSDQARDTND